MIDLSRRQFSDGLLACATTFAASGFAIMEHKGVTTKAKAQEVVEPAHDLSAMPAHWMGKEQIAFLIYPGFTALDMIGPHYMLTNLMGATVHIVAATPAPVTSDTGLVFTPSHTFADCPADLDILCVPGGTTGTLAAMQDEATMAFLRDRGARAKYVTSVCTGSLVLAAAGLLQGYKATSHWIAKDSLAHFGAIPTDGRIVQDRNRITGGGVTAGIDFGLMFIATLRDRQYAEAVQLLAEYAPEPPFNAGTPETAPKETMQMMQSMLAGFVQKVDAFAKARKT